MTSARRFTLTAKRELPELRLRSGDVELELKAGDKIVVDRCHPIAPVTLGGLPIRDPDSLMTLTMMVFRSRGERMDRPFTVRPSVIGAQRTLENLHAEACGSASRATFYKQLRAIRAVPDLLGLEAGDTFAIEFDTLSPAGAELLLPAGGGSKTMDAADLRALSVALKNGSLVAVMVPTIQELCAYLDAAIAALPEKGD